MYFAKFPALWFIKTLLLKHKEKRYSVSSRIKMEVRLKQRTFQTKAATRQFLCFLQKHKIVVYMV